jgi:ABC-type dipeptide/oligopeptide/nickel transport system permease component
MKSLGHPAANVYRLPLGLRLHDYLLTLFLSGAAGWLSPRLCGEICFCNLARSRRFATIFPSPSMLRYISTRLLYMVPVIWLVVSVVFLLIHLVPGDPIQQMLGEGAASADVQAARHAYGLDVPLPQQYVNYWKGVLHGNLGRSLRFDQPVTGVILQRYPKTILLTVASMIVALLISIPAGVRSARRRNRWDDRLLSFVSLWGLSFPNFALGPILILFFAIRLGLLPVSGYGTLAHLVLPAITMGGALAAILTRMVRTAMLEELGQDYIRTARAKGLSENVVVYKHALRNALVPVLTVVGLQFGALLAGAIVTETIFSWPGIGRLTISAISSRDYYLVQGCILMIGLTYVAVNFLTDFFYSLANPRIRQ